MYTSASNQTFEMGFSRKEFETLLQQQQRFQFSQSGDQVEIDWQGGKVSLVIGQQGERRIASFLISKLPINMNLDLLDVNKRKPFLSAFFKTFQKGGG
jgi:hypothetical protein